MISARIGARVVAQLVLGLLTLDASAQLRAAPERVDARPQLEMSTLQTPRFENIDGATTASRMDLTLLAPGRAAIGPSVGVTSVSGPTFNNAGLANTSPAVDLGVHVRYVTDDNNRVDVRAWRRLPQNDALTQLQSHDASYGARVEMRIAQVPKSGLIADHGIGMQLESGARITLHRSGGKPMMFYRAKF